jgi:malate synthase
VTEILSADVVAFVADLNRRFRPRRNALLSARARRRAETAAGGSLGFLPETADVRARERTLPPAPGERVAPADDRADFRTVAAYDPID